MPTSWERVEALQQELRTLFAKAKMPSSPALASQILELMSDPRSNAADFGAVIQNDVALSASLLKAANSAAFAQRNPATTIGRAVTVLGLNRVKTISLGFQLVAHLDQLGGVPFDVQQFWLHSVLRACLARSIAQSLVPRREEEAFLVGLLQECGVLLLVQLLGEDYARLYRSRLSPDAFHSLERESFKYSHTDVIAALAAEWTLPELIATPLREHHTEPAICTAPSDIDLLVAVSRFVGSLCFAPNRTVGPDESESRDAGRKVLGLDDGAWTRAQRRASDEFKRVSALYERLLPKGVDITDLLAEANRQLVTVATDVERQVRDAQAERDSVLRERGSLENALRDYRERSALDPLTHVMNRGALAEATRNAIEWNLDGGGTISMLFVDLDNFKALNDTFGHQVGDKVLKAVAALFQNEVGSTGTVGRYGGEEFVILLQGLSAEDTRAMAERLLRQVRAVGEGTLEPCGTVTCSIGVLWTEHFEAKSAEDLFHTADGLMYRAKRNGKNCCCFEFQERTTAESVQAAHAVDPPGRSSGDGVRPSQKRPNEQDLLEVASRLRECASDSFGGIRKESRTPIVLPCTLHYFTGLGMSVHTESAVTRNISTGGIGLVVARPMVRGEAVELALEKDEARLYLGGLVSFCRHIERGIHEIGIQFVSQSVAPIISSNAAEALERHDWLAQSLMTKRKRQLESECAAEPQVTHTTPADA